MKKTELERVRESSEAYRARGGAGEEGLANRASAHSVKVDPSLLRMTSLRTKLSSWNSVQGKVVIFLPVNLRGFGHRLEKPSTEHMPVIRMSPCHPPSTDALRLNPFPDKGMPRAMVTKRGGHWWHHLNPKPCGKDTGLPSLHWALKASRGVRWLKGPELWICLACSLGLTSEHGKRMSPLP